MGSPPRGRGKGNISQHSATPFRITPAWAGKSYSPSSVSSCVLDHPRVGGEKLLRWKNIQNHKGSPPRGRGKAITARRQQLVLRITPAWAGKRQHLPGGTGRGEDHPRVGGEKTPVAQARLLSSGSPPRGRGKGGEVQTDKTFRGITPAWAGKRLKRSHRSGIFISGPIPFHSVLHRPAGSGGSRAGRDGSPAGQPQNTGPA